MLKNFLLLFLLILCAGLAGCTPPSIPAGASVHWDKEWGFYWTWTRRFEHGCVEWTATDGWALVDLQMDSQCGTPHVSSAGIDYASGWDEIVFNGWWTQDPGEMNGRGGQCPYQISESQIAGLRRTVGEALTQAETEGERRVLGRINERLQVVNGAALWTHQIGACSDLTPAERAAATLRATQESSQDSWQDGR